MANYSTEQIEKIKKLQEMMTLPAAIPPNMIPPEVFRVAWDTGSAQISAAQPEAGKPAQPKKLKQTTGTVKLDSVVLADGKREEIKAAISQMSNERKIFDEWGFSEVFEKGTAITLLFYGTPGTGKTLMAQAIANELGADLKTYGMAEIGSSEPGGSERIIKKIFATAKEFFSTKKKPQVILFDECDALLYDRNKVGVILGAQINALLTEIERHEGIIIFTTNRIGTLDPALERRIAAKIEFPFPDLLQRKAIWERMVPQQAPLADDVDFIVLADYKIAGGNIKNAVLNAARMAAYKDRPAITMADFMAAVERELQSQDAFKKEADQYVTSPISKQGEDLGIGEDRKISIVSDGKRSTDRKGGKK
jgi:SpoVK/Ycf46/Vps4 family AAA+-type ATPase